MSSSNLLNLSLDAIDEEQTYLLMEEDDDKANTENAKGSTNGNGPLPPERQQQQQLLLSEEEIMAERQKQCQRQWFPTLCLTFLMGLSLGLLFCFLYYWPHLEQEQEQNRHHSDKNSTTPNGTTTIGTINTAITANPIRITLGKFSSMVLIPHRRSRPSTCFTRCGDT